MLVSAGLLAFVALAVLIIHRNRHALGTARGIALGVLVLVLTGTAWSALKWGQRQTPQPPEPPAAEAIASQTCLECHESHYKSWQQTFHRTMTRDATPENIKAEFDGTEHKHVGVTSRMVRQGDRYLLDTVDPEWASRVARQGIPLDKAGAAPRKLLSIDRVVGSHWFQQFMHRDDEGRYLRLPMAYHIVEKRWIHIDGAFLAPDTGHFFSKVAVWNETCLFCHNTQ